MTLVEILCVLAILAIIAALLLIGVQQSRESARRMQCESHMRQWGIALHSHESLRGTFPPGYRLDSPSSSFVPFLLPFIEGNGTGYDSQLSWADPGNQASVQTTIRLLICPATPNRNRFDGSRGFPAAIGDYTAVHGVNASYSNLLGWPPFVPPNENGVLTRDGLPAAAVTDGLSQTVAIVEVAGRPFLWRNGVAATGTAPHGAWADPEYEIGISGADHLAYGSGAGNGRCAINCTNDNEVYGFHAGGANFLFADGSVRYVGAQIDERIFAALITRSARDKVDFSQF
jgi:prepilin-type processing-associated H-X9-DG protein